MDLLLAHEIAKQPRRYLHATVKDLLYGMEQLVRRGALEQIANGTQIERTGNVIDPCRCR
jgi:hypothetical protein